MRFLFGLLFLAGCGAATVAYKSEAGKLYANKCGGCHRLIPKEEYSKEKWPIEVEAMSKKAKLLDDEKRMIIEFLTSD